MNAGANVVILRSMDPGKRSFDVKESSVSGTFKDAPSKIRARILARIAWLVVSFWSRSIKTRFVNREVPERFKAEGKNVIFAFFHGDLLALLHSHRDAGLLVPASESRDGEIMARVLRNFGFEVVRGSTKRNGHKALLALIRGMRRGRTVAIAVDGPRGPLREVKTGAVFLAGISQAPIIPVTAAAKHSTIAEKSWDKLVIPAPFTECLVQYGDPIYVKNASSDEIVSAQRKLETDLRRLTHEVVLRRSAGGRPGSNRNQQSLTRRNG